MKIKLKNPKEVQKPTAGFTLVEVLVTTVVVSLFIFGFFQVYTVLESQRINVARQAYASDVAYSNLRKVASRPAGLTVTQCNDYMDMLSSNPANKVGLDLTGVGYTLEPDVNVKKSLGSAATQTLLAFAPSGCSNLATAPIKIVSTVTFGTSGDKVTHASFVK